MIKGMGLATVTTRDTGTLGSVIPDMEEVTTLFERRCDELPFRRGGEIDYYLWLVNGLEEGDSCDG